MSHSSRAARSGGTCIWTRVSCHMCLRRNIAATPHGHFKDSSVFCLFLLWVEVACAYGE